MQPEYNNAPALEVEQTAKVRRPSTMLMKFLLDEKLYAQAAELALGMESVFAMLGRQIDEVIDDKERCPDRISFTDHLKPKIDKAHAEIGFNCKWSQDILSELPDANETLVIRKSFNQVALARTKLLNKLLSIHDRYLLAQQQDFRRSQARYLNSR